MEAQGMPIEVQDTLENEDTNEGRVIGEKNWRLKPNYM